MDIHINVNQLKWKHMFDIKLNLFGVAVNNRYSETDVRRCVTGGELYVLVRVCVKD